MKITIALFPAFAAVSFLPAQDGKVEPQQMPDPKTAQHEALRALAGDWTTVCKMAAMPGVPGMEQPTESTGTDKVELVCNGLWVKWTMDGTMNGQPAQCLGLVGYDPFAKGYKSIWVSSGDEAPMLADATFDEKTSTWTFTGTCKHGAMRSVYVLKGDTAVETVYMTPPGGTEVRSVEITRTRVKGGVPRDALTKVAKVEAASTAKELAPLAASTGSWAATVTMAMPGQPPTTEKGSEVVRSTCNGRWTWSDFTGQMMGMPFEGHALTGYDPDKKEYVSFWIDSLSATHAMTTGTFDPATKAFRMAGNCLCPVGERMEMQQTHTQPDADTRNLKMTFKHPQGSHDMTIAYVRKG